jgi:predicted ATPase/DNA-binding XRE family transcriptional regulator
VTSTRDPSPFAATLRRYREAAGLSQEALAEKAGLSARGVSDLERGLSRVPRLDTLTRLAEAMGLGQSDREALLRASGRLSGDGSRLAAVPPGQDASPPPSGLPSFLTRLRGREREQAALRRLLAQPDVRLLTLVGPGGVGKTRLAVQAAAACADLFPDGVAFAPLAPLRDPSLVLATIAQAVGIGETGDAPLADSLVLALHDRRFLLVLDNCEHLLEAAPAVARVLSRCRHLRVLATSRTRLRLQGEHVFAVDPLALPDTADNAADALRWPAVALFAERAQAARPTFELSDEHLPAVLGICRRLDGLPLALELAAARVSILPPAALLERLDQRLPALGTATRDAPARQRTLQSTIAWSYDLLTDEQRRLLRCLSVFSGGWTLDLAEAVSGESAAPGHDRQGDRADQHVQAVEASVLDGLAALAEHSLIQPQDHASGEPRFTMLVTVGLFALEELERSGEAAVIRERHARAVLELAEAAERHLLGARRLTWLRRLDLDLDNVRAALAWSLSPDGDVELGQRLGGSLSWYWYHRGHLREGRDWQERLLAADTRPTPTPGRARAHFVIGGISLMQGDARTSRRYLEHAAALYETQRDAWRRAQALTLLGIALASLGDAQASLDRYRDSVELARGLDDRWLEAYALINEGAARVLLDELAQADALYRSSLALFETLADDWGRAIALRALAGLAVERGDAAGARVVYEQSVPLFRQTGDVRGLAQALLALGKTALREGDLAQARQALTESVVRWREVGISGGIVRCLSGLAEIEAASGEAPVAVRLFAATRRQAEAFGVRFAEVDQVEHNRALGALRGRVPEEQFAADWQTGQAQLLDQVVAEAIGPADQFTPLVKRFIGLRGSY